MKLDSTVIIAALKSISVDKILEAFINFSDEITVTKIINAIFRKEKLTLNNIDYNIIAEKLSFRHNVEIKDVKITNPLYGEIEVSYTYNDAKYYDNPEFNGESTNYETATYKYAKLEEERSDGYSYMNYFE